MLQSTAFLIAGVAFGGVLSWWAIAVVPVAMLAAMALSAPLCAFSAGQDSDVGFDLIMRIGIVPLYLFSGTVFPLEQLPSALQAIVKLFPLYHGVAVARMTTTGVGDLVAIAGHLAVLAGYIAVGVWLARRSFVKRLTP